MLSCILTQFLLSFTFFTSSLVFAAPVDARNVFIPQILSPLKGDIWRVGENYTVAWNTSDTPSHITNPLGRVMLRRGANTLNITLASKFDILSGAVNVTVPTVAPGNDYRIVLFGDSGNWSPKFSIKYHGKKT